MSKIINNLQSSSMFRTVMRFFKSPFGFVTVTTMLGLCSGLFFQKGLIAGLTKKIQQLNEELKEEKRLRAHERKNADEQRAGRTRIERELRKMALEQGGLHSSLGTPIGYLESCFRERNGTPRQGGVVPAGRSILRLKGNVNPLHSLEGLEKFSHVWLIFIFHVNTNVTRGIRTDRPGSVVKAKVAPPRLDGEKMGLFATRTPHRPNPIGLSVAKIDKIVNGVLYLSGADLVDGTPILDVKPYIPHYDTIQEAVAPDWTVTPPIPPLKSVTFLPSTEIELQNLIGKLRFYDKYEDVHAVIEQILIQDIRSVRRRKDDKFFDKSGHKPKSRFIVDDGNPERHRVAIDNLLVHFTVVDQHVTVDRIELDPLLNSNENRNNNNNNDDDNNNENEGDEINESDDINDKNNFSDNENELIQSK